ncbi:SAV_915 family protein [Prescottella sp. R16]|uniref:SAV_915 family protein n=1 Tax=Prescottella sp. R16 TaxID=3064529 RepID=UPI00272E1F9A|nr:SAV_915 family protein [Prescottella sp. R16]
MRGGILYLPITGRPGAMAQLELRRLPDGRLALPAYTTLDQLVTCCGPHQPWASVDDTGLRDVAQTTGYDTVLLDAELPAEARHREMPPEPDEYRPTSWLSDGWGDR